MRTKTHIPPADHRLFLRCLELHKISRQARKDIDALKSSPLYGLRGVLDHPLPEEMRRQIESTVSRADKESARLQAAQEELDRLCVDAEEAAQRVQNSGLRSFIRLYCLDGLTYTRATETCGCSARSAQRYAAMLHRPPID